MQNTEAGREASGTPDPQAEGAGREMYRPAGEKTFTYLFAAALFSRIRGLDAGERSALIASFPCVESRSAGSLRRVVREYLKRRKSEYAALWDVPPGRALLQAAARAEAWREKGIRVLEGVLSSRSESPDPSLPVLFGIGSPVSLEGCRSCVLNSRKGRRVNPPERWIRLCGHAVARTAAKGRRLVTSYGNLPYDLVTYAAVKRGLSLWVVCPDVSPFAMAEGKEPTGDLGERLDLFPAGNTVFLTPVSPGALVRKSVGAKLRDRVVIALSDELWLCEIRAGGTMESLALEAIRWGKRLRVFRPREGDKRTAGNRNLLDAIRSHGEEDPDPPVSSPRLRRAPAPSRGSGAPFAKAPERGPFLVHYTRGHAGPWPGQSIVEYLEEIFLESAGSAHTALDALVRILREQRIRAGGRLIRGNTPVVSFTECMPREMRSLIRWRRALVRWSFEPYGIVFPRQVLARLGCVPVIYGPRATYEALPPSLRFRFQLCSTEGTDWTAEREWRHAGDFSFGKIEKAQIRVVVPSEAEADVIWRRFGIETWIV